MQMPSPLGRVPKAAFVAVMPVVAFLVVLGISLGSGEEKSSDEVASAAPTAGSTSTPGSSPTAVVTPTALANRANCQAIQGSAYQSDAERDWYVQNCRGGGGGGAAAGPAGSAEAASGAEYALGDTLIIPAAGVNTVVYGSTVGGDGKMATPVGYFYALWYDFKSHPGVGGYVDRGNLVLAGHVDCARCQGGGPGAAVFYNVRNLRAGDAIQYRTANGQVQNYVVTSAQWYLPESDWGSILSAGAADLTIVTCIGTFDSSRREYSNRLVVYARKS